MGKRGDGISHRGRHTREGKHVKVSDGHTPTKLLQGKSQETPNIGENEKHPELSYISGGSVKCYNHFVTLYSSFL